MACGLWSAACGVPNYSAAVNAIVIFSVGSRSAVSIPGGESFILAKNLPLHGPNPGSSLFSLEGLLGRSPPGEAFWHSAAAECQPGSGAQIGFLVFWLFSERRSGVPPGNRRGSMRLSSLPQAANGEGRCSRGLLQA